MWGQETPFELDTLCTTVEATSSPPFRTGCVPVKCPAPVWQCTPLDLHPRLLSPLLPSESHCLVQVASFPKHTGNGGKLGKRAGNKAIVQVHIHSLYLPPFLPSPPPSFIPSPFSPFSPTLHAGGCLTAQSIQQTQVHSTHSRESVPDVLRLT